MGVVAPPRNPDGSTGRVRRRCGLSSSVDGTSFCCTAWPVSKEPRTLASTGEVATTVDELQYGFGRGPCLSAAADPGVVRISDLATDERWPQLAQEVLARTPVRAVLSCHLVEDPQRCALNMYGPEPGAFDNESINVAALFAAHARVLLIHAASVNKATNLEHALTTSRQIGAAVGILMSAHKITADDAFELLRVSSQHLHRKLHDIAFDVTQTGVLPEL